MNLPIELHLTVTDPVPVSTLLQQQELDDDVITSCLQNGSVWLQKNGKPRRIHKAGLVLKSGQQVHFYCNEQTLRGPPYQPQLISDYQKFSLWFKPAGMLSQGSKWGDHWALYRWIELNHWPQRQCFITHRLDRFTSGLMLVAHDSDTNSLFHRQFEQRIIQKTYRAWVRGIMSEDEEILVEEPIEGKPAQTRIRPLSRQNDRNRTLVEVTPLTGRKHQIRIHLMTIGHPVLNDRQHAPPPYAGDMQLQSCSLRFLMPGHEEEQVCIQLPDTDLLQ